MTGASYVFQRRREGRDLAAVQQSLTARLVTEEEGLWIERQTKAGHSDGSDFLQRRRPASQSVIMCYQSFHHKAQVIDVRGDQRVNKT